MQEVERLILTSVTILVIDYPTEDVPIELARTGRAVYVHGGPEPDNYTMYARNDEEVVSTYIGSPPESAELVYTYRPVDELQAIAKFSRALGAETLWWQPDETATAEDARRAREVVEAEGLTFVDTPAILDVARSING